MNACHGRRRFLLFTGFDHQEFHLETAAPETVQATIAVGAGHIRVADHENLAAGTDPGGNQLGSDAAQGSITDHHLVRRRLQFHINATERRGLGDGHGS